MTLDSIIEHSDMLKPTVQPLQLTMVPGGHFLVCSSVFGVKIELLIVGVKIKGEHLLGRILMFNFFNPNYRNKYTNYRNKYTYQEDPPK